MVAVAVASAVLAYVWAIGLTGNLMGGGGSQVKEQLIVESYRWQLGGQLAVTLRNVGTTSVTIGSVYLGGNLTASGLENQPVGVGFTITGTWTPSGAFTAGTAYVLKVVTATGAVMTSTLISGHYG